MRGPSAEEVPATQKGWRKGSAEPEKTNNVAGLETPTVVAPTKLLLC